MHRAIVLLTYLPFSILLGHAHLTIVTLPVVSKTVQWRQAVARLPSLSLPMDTFSLAKSCYQVLSTCVKLSRRLNQIVETSRNVDDFITQALKETECLYRVLRSINTTILNNPSSKSFLTSDNDAGALREAMAQAIIGSGAAVARFETIFNEATPTNAALAGQRLRARSSELLHIRQQMQTYTGILQMALHTITV